MRPWPVLCLALILGPLLVHGLGRSTVLPAGSGIACGSRPPRLCVQEAPCTPEGCRCPEEGDGRFVCYKTGVQRIEIKDNELQTWNGNLTTAIFPCRLRLTAFETVGSGAVASCFTQVFSLHQVVDGQTLLIGVDVFFHVSLTSGEVRRIGFRLTGILARGSYSFYEKGTVPEDIEQPVNRSIPQDMDGSGSGDGDSIISDDDESFDQDESIVWGYPEVLALPDGATISSFIGDDNFGVIQALSCGVTVKFRPSDTNYISESNEVPGLSVAVNEGSGATSVIFPNSQTYVAGPQQIDFSKPMTPEQTLVSIALNYEAQQDGSDGEECLATGQVYHEVCQTQEARDDAVIDCSAFFDGNLVYCLHVNSGPSAIRLFRQCMQFTCNSNFATCNTLLSSWAPVTSCHKYLPLLVSQLQCNDY